MSEEGRDVVIPGRTAGACDPDCDSRTDREQHKTLRAWREGARDPSQVPLYRSNAIKPEPSADDITEIGPELVT